MGHGLMISPSVSPLLEYFDQKFAIANGISTSGGGVGMTILPMVAYIFLQTYGWRGCLLLLAALNLHCLVGGALMRSPNNSKDTKQKYESFRQKSSTDSRCSLLRKHTKHEPINQKSGTESEYSSLLEEGSKGKYDNFAYQFGKDIQQNLKLDLFWTKPRFLLYQILFLLYGVQYTGWTMFLVSNAIHKGFSHHDAALLSTLGGIGNTLGRAGSGFVGYYTELSNKGLFSAMSLCCAVSLLLDPVTYHYSFQVILAIVAGMAIGTRFPVSITIARDFGDDDIAVVTAVGWSSLFIGVGCLLGGAIVGKQYI